METTSTTTGGNMKTTTTGDNVEEIRFGSRVWWKSKGDEGQDVYVAQFMSDENEMLGKYVDSSSYDIVVDEDADFYLPKGSFCDSDDLTEDDCAFKFRKGVFTHDEQVGAYEGLYDAASKSDNRGLAAGPRPSKHGYRAWVTEYQNDILDYYISGQKRTVDGSDMFDDIKRKHESVGEDNRGTVWLRKQISKVYGKNINHDFFPTLIEELNNMSVDDASAHAKHIKKDFISSTAYAASLWSGIAGFYGRYPRFPFGRPTAYVENNEEQFAKCYPFARKLDTVFKKLMPVRWAKQNEFAKRLDNKFLIGGDTSFTTITVNTTTADRNARMACHRDAGSLNEGFSNLLTITKDGKSWKGGYLVCPEVGAAINCRPGDLLLIDNMRIIHANSPIEAPDSGDEDFLRMSLVFYFREDMDQLGSWEYEALRRKYVNGRRKNPDHPLQRRAWNGVSSNMFEQQEWYDYLELNMGREIVEKYHPAVYSQKPNTLEAFL